MQTKTYTNLAAFLALLVWMAGGRPAMAASAGASIAYVAQVQGKATAQSGTSAPRVLERFSPLFAGDALTLDKGGKLTARFVSTGQTQIYADTDPPTKRRVTAPIGPSNDVKSRLLRAVFDDQRAGLAKASRNVQGATRGAFEISEPFHALLPRKKVLLQNLAFTWRAQSADPVQITVYDSENTQIWQAKDIKANHFTYPADAPALKSGETYHWTVGRSGSEAVTDTSLPATFTFVKAAQEKDMVERVDMLKSVTFTDAEEADMAIASQLFKAGLYSNVLQTLSPLTDKSISPMARMMRLHAYHALELKEDADAEKEAIGKSGDALKAQWLQAEGSPE